VPAVLGLWETSRSAASITPDTPEAVDALIGQPGSVLLLALEGDEVVGTLVVGWDGWRGNMYRLAVRSDFRRRGIALALVEAGHEHLRSVGARRVTALVGVEESGAAALWLAAGYEHDRKIERFVRNLARPSRPPA
jgi:ribosomal protein S18 acetylase RimI-like enzyme